MTCNITALFYSFTEAICDLLKINLSVVAGFVYSKITEAQKDQKELVVQVASRDLKSRMPEYELIRIIGILIDNALESTAPFGTAYLYLDSRQNQIEIRVPSKPTNSARICSHRDIPPKPETDMAMVTVSTT